MAKRQYVFQPVGLDVYDRRPGQPAPGTVVVKVQPGHGAPRNGTMGHCYVRPVDGDEHEYVLVLLNSLVPKGKAA